MSSIQCGSNQFSTPKAFQEHVLVSRACSREERGKMHVIVVTHAFLKNKKLEVNCNCVKPVCLKTSNSDPGQ